MHSVCPQILHKVLCSYPFGNIQSSQEGFENKSLYKNWGASRVQYTYDKHKKITDHNEQEQNENENGLFKTSLIFFANETVTF